MKPSVIWLIRAVVYLPLCAVAIAFLMPLGYAGAAAAVALAMVAIASDVYVTARARGKTVTEVVSERVLMADYLLSTSDQKAVDRLESGRQPVPVSRRISRAAAGRIDQDAGPSDEFSDLS